MKRYALLIWAVVWPFLSFGGDDSLKHFKTSITKQDIVDDLDIYRESMNEKHINPYSRVRKKVFYAAVAELKDSAEHLNVDELMYRWLKVNALIGDEHTGIFYQRISLNRFPFVCYWFEDGLYVTDATEANKDLLRCNLVAINGIPVKQACERLYGLLPNDNRSVRKQSIPGYLVEPCILHGAGIIPTRDKATYTFVTEHGDTLRRELIAEDKQLMSFKRGVDHSIFLRFRKNIHNWYGVQDSGKWVYFHYGLCMDTRETKVANLLEDLQHDIDTRHPGYLVIDLRENSGGSSRLLMPFVKYLNTSYLNKKGHIYVLTGRRTYSSAVLNTLSLKRYLNVILVGEETGGNASHYGERGMFQLPHSLLEVSYSKRYFASEDANEGPVRPDVSRPSTARAFFTGHDNALEYVIGNMDR